LGHALIIAPCPRLCISLRRLPAQLAHEAAFGADTPFGMSHLCPRERISEITADTLRGYMSELFVAPRMVLSGAGVDHDELVAYASEFFKDLPVAPRTPDRPLPGIPVYKGGFAHMNLPADSTSPYTHVVVFFPCLGWRSDDIVPVCVLDMLLGGGSSFSAGGPGKGMYSRLYREVLNVYGWVESANAFNTQGTDIGLFGISGAAEADGVTGLASLICMQLGELTYKKVKPEELSRAQNQLMSSVLMNLETRSMLCEDIGRQMIMLGHRISPQELCNRINAVTADDIQRIVRKAMASKPSLAVFGDASQLDYKALVNAFKA